MKLDAGLMAALAGCAAASQQSAEVFIVPSNDASSPPAVAPSLARLLFLQRLASNGQGFVQQDVPSNIDAADAISFLNRFGKPTLPLFSTGETNQPSQLVLMLDSMNGSQMKNLGETLGSKPSFIIADPPAERAHRELMELDFLYRSGVANGNECSLEQIANPMEDCWNGQSSAVAKFSMNEDPETIEHVAKQIKQLVQLAKSGDLETAIIVLPRTKSSSQWADDDQQELRRRQAERVMSSVNKTASPPQPTSPSGPGKVIFPPSSRIASCYETLSACNEATGNCTGHGACKDKYASSDGTKAAVSCFACHCQATRDEGKGVTHWGGASCAKEDVSVPFWLFAGFTVAMIGILSMSVGLLYGVGGEKLPGVIGAGVSRNK